MATWEQVVLGILVVLLLLWFFPGIKRMLQQSREAEEKDWKGLLLPLGVVVLFVLLLISLV
jgi:O-antigen/teichoic acid export membrane protein